MAEPESAASAQKDKDVAYVGEDDRSSLTSYDAQAGVKGIEAISQTWSKWALISAYVGYVVYRKRNAEGINLRVSC